MKTSVFITFFTGVFLSLLLNCVSAQTFILHSMPKEKSQFGLRFMRPAFEQDEDLSPLSGVYDFSLNIPLSETWNIVGSIPYVTFAFGESDAENGVGNIYIGAQTHDGFKDNNGSVGSFGLFLPTAKEDIGFFGMLTNYYDIHKYVSDLLTIYGNYAYHKLSSQGLRYGLEIGPNIMISTKGEGRDTELFMHYGLTAGFQGKNFAIFTELVGLVIITEDIDEFSDRFYHSIDLGATYISNNISPGVFYKLYLKENLSDIVKGVLGIKIDVTVN